MREKLRNILKGVEEHGFIVGINRSAEWDKDFIDKQTTVIGDEMVREHDLVVGMASTLSPIGFIEWANEHRKEVFFGLASNNSSDSASPQSLKVVDSLGLKPPISGELESWLRRILVDALTNYTARNILLTDAVHESIDKIKVVFRRCGYVKTMSYNATGLQSETDRRANTDSPRKLAQ